MASELSVQSNREPGDLVHDSANSHTNLKIMDSVAQLGWPVLTPPPYSLDLTPSDFHLFGSMKDALHGTKFEDYEHVVRAVKKWLPKQERDWHRRCVHGLVSRWRKTRELSGEFVGK